MTLNLSREELLSGGLPGRRASMLLFAIENRTGQLIEQGVRDTAVYLTIAGSQTREEDFFAALASGRQAKAVTIQQLERYAPLWQSLLPEPLDPKLSASLGQLLGEKYKFTYAETPNLRKALHLNDSTVEEAFLGAYDRALDTIYAPRVDLPSQAGFAWARLAARLEALPPFWQAFFLTWPGAAGLLALPVSLAGVGLGGGLLLLAAFGLINMLTVAALAEATARSGITRFGLGWLGQLVQEYLGGAGSFLLTTILALDNFLVLIIFFLGLGGTLQDATRVPAVVWILALFGICVLFLSRGSLKATLASTLLIVFAMTALLLIIPALALPSWNPDNLANAFYVSFDFTSLQLALGLLLSTFFSHLLVATYGTVVMRRDTSGRTWIRGSTASILAYMAIAGIWLVVVNGTIPLDVLATVQGTILTPLAEQAGSIILVLGSILVILSLGLASVQIALGLFYLVQERLPAPGVSPAFSKPRVRFFVALLPVIIVLLVAEWLAFTGEGSFASLLGISGAFALPLLSGVFPVLLLASTRRRGDFSPSGVWRLLGSPFVLVPLYLFFVGVIFVYGIWIFQTAWTRGIMLVIGVTVLVVTATIIRRGKLEPRAVFEVRLDQREGGGASYSLVSNGEPLSCPVELRYAHEATRRESSTGEIPAFDALQAIWFQLPAGAARELKVWAHQLSPSGESRGLNARLLVHSGSRNTDEELSATRPQRSLPLNGAVAEVSLTLPTPRAEALDGPPA